MFKKFLITSCILMGIGAANAAGVIRVPFTLAAGTNTTQNYNFGDVGVGQYVYATFTYKNTSNSELQITGNSSEGAIDIVSSDCGTSLAAQATCSVIVGFSVSNLGVNTAAVKFTTNQYSNPDIFSVSATGISPTSVLEISPASATYSYSSEEKTFTITNPRTYAIKIDNVIPSSNYWAVTSNTCSSELQPNSNCVVKAKYVTTKQGTYSASLKITSQSLTVGQASLSASSQYGSPGFSVNAINLPTLMVGVPYTGDLSVTNTGRGNLIISDVLFESPSDALSFPKNDCASKTLEPGQSCSLQYRVLFSSATSLQSGISFRFSNATTSYSTVGMFASAVASNPILSVSSNFLDFGVNSVGQSSSQAITLKSIGNAPVTVSNIVLSGNSAFTLLNKAACIGSLTAGNQCTLNVQFQAPAVAADTTHTGDITITNNSSTPVSPVNLTAKTVKATLVANPLNQSITGPAGQSYFKDYLISNTSSVAAKITAISLINGSYAYTLENSTCTVNQSIDAGKSCIIRVNLNNAVAGTGAGTVSVKYGTVDSLQLSVNHNIEAVYSIAEVGDISCPDISASTTIATAITQYSPYVCTLSINNPGDTPLYLPNNTFGYTSNTGGFSVVDGRMGVTQGVFGYKLDPKVKTKVTFTHAVPLSAGVISADIKFKVYGKAGLESSATEFKRTAQVNVAPAKFALTDVVCPSSVYITQPVVCSANIYNNSLTEFSVLTGGTNLLKATNQIAAKFSQTTVDSAPISGLTTLKPVKDTMPTALTGNTPGFYWTTATPNNCVNSSYASKIMPGGKCATTITFTPTIAGDYSIPLYIVTDKDPSQWVASATNATFSVKKATLDLTATPFDCPAVYPNAIGTCTTTLSNATPVGIANTYPVPTITINGAAAPLISKTNLGAIKTTTTCPATGIAPGASCKLSVTFMSPVPGSYIGKAALTSKGETDQIDIIPVVSVPDISLSAFICPDAAVGEPGVCSATFKNAMTTSVTISTVTKASVPVGFENPTVTPLSVPAGQSSTVKLPYKFTTAGTFSTTVSVNTNYGTVSAPASLTTKEYPPAEGSLSAFTCPVLYYGQVDKCTATLSNLSSSKTLPVNTATLLNNKYFTLFTGISHDCGKQLAPSGTCTVSVAVSGVSAGNAVFNVDAQVSTNPVLTQKVNLETKSVLFSIIKPPIQRVSINNEARVVIGFKNETAVAVPVFEKNIVWSTRDVKTGGYYLIKNECVGVKAPQEVCNITLGLKSATPGYVTGYIAMSFGAGIASTEFITEVVIPKLEVVLAYPGSSGNVGFSSNSGNWYKVTNQSPESVSIKKFTPVAGTMLLMDSNNAGNCYVGKVLASNESCLFFDTLNATTTTGAPLKFTNASLVEASNGVKGNWVPTYTAMWAKMEMSDSVTALFGIAGDQIVGQIKLTNPTDGYLRGISISPALNTTAKGVFSWTDSGCSAELPRGGVCYKSFTYQPAVGDNGTITFTADGIFARIIHGVAQDSGGTRSVVAKLSINVKAEKPIASTPNITFTPTAAFGGPSEDIRKEVYIYNKGNVAFKILGIKFNPTADIELFNASNCVNRVLKPGESCYVMSKYQSSRVTYNAPPASVEFTITGGDVYIAKLSVLAPPNQSKLCTFGESYTFTSVFTGCMRNASAYDGPAACSPAYNWNSWLDPIFFDGLPVYKDNKMVTPGKTLTWKSSGLPVTQVITKVGNVSYGFNVKPVLQIWMGGKWTAMWGGSNSSGTALARSNTNNIYNYGFGAGTTFAVPADVGGGANPLYTPSGNPYTEFISTGTTRSGYYARQAWIEVTPGPYCHQPGSGLANE